MVSPWLIEVFFVGWVTLGGLLILAKGLQKVLEAYRLYATRTTSIADLPNVSGSVEVKGVARVHDRTIETPVTGTPCLAYAWEVEERQKHYDSIDEEWTTRWATIASGSTGVPFRVEDETGSVLVDPGGADFRLEKARERIPVTTRDWMPEMVREAKEELGGRGDVSERVRRTIDDLEEDVVPAGIPVESWFTGPQRYTVSRLDPDEPVYVHGTVTYAPGESRKAGEVNARIEDGKPFVVADGTEFRAILRVLREAAVYVLFGLVFLGLAVFLYLFADWGGA